MSRWDAWRTLAARWLSPSNAESSNTSQPASWFIDGMSAAPIAAGVSISAQNALEVTTAYIAVNVISETIASLPLNLYREQNGGRIKGPTHPLQDVLSEQANRFQTAFEFWQWIVPSVLHHGNGYAWIRRDELGRANEMIPVRPEWVTPGWARPYEVGYVVRVPGEKPIALLKSEMLHVRGFPSADGLTGIGVVAWQRAKLGEAKAEADFGARLFANGTKLSGILRVDGQLAAGTAEQIREEWEEIYGGQSNSHKVAVLGGNADFKPVSMTAVDSDYLNAKKMTRSEIGALYRVPPVFIGDHEHSTFSNNEQQDLHFSKHTITPWVRKIEQAVARDCLTESERGRRFYVKFNLNALERGDYKGRIEGYAKLIEMGVNSPNEIRALEDQPPREGGDVYMTPLNMRESGPDARPDPEPSPEPDNRENSSETAQNRLLFDTIERVLTRDERALAKAVKQLREKSDPAALMAMADASEDFLSKVLLPALAALRPNANGVRLVAEHVAGLSALIALGVAAHDAAAETIETAAVTWFAQQRERMAAACGVPPMETA